MKKADYQGWAELLAQVHVPEKVLQMAEEMALLLEMDDSGFTEREKIRLKFFATFVETQVNTRDVEAIQRAIDASFGEDDENLDPPAGSERAVGLSRHR